MWLNRTDYGRLLTEAARSDMLAQALAVAQERARNAEESLTSERAAKDWLTLQLSSRLVTKSGGYGLEHEAPIKPPPPNPNRYTHDPTDIDLAKLKFYKKCAREAGHGESDAVVRWEAEMRGEGLPIEYDEAEQ